MAREERREPRYNVAVDASFLQGSAERNPVKVLNLSATGCRFSLPVRRLPMGTYITLSFGKAGLIDARVRWRLGDTHGVRFRYPLQPAVLDHIRLFLSKEPALVAERDPLAA